MCFDISCPCILPRHAFNREVWSCYQPSTANNYQLHIPPLHIPPPLPHKHTHTHVTRGMLYLCHGVGEYMGRYEKLGEFLAENGVLMFGHDHGRYAVYNVL